MELTESMKALLFSAFFQGIRIATEEQWTWEEYKANGPERLHKVLQMIANGESTYVESPQYDEADSVETHNSMIELDRDLALIFIKNLEAAHPDRFNK